MKSKRVFVQIGATRDGLESYLAAARRRRMHTVLVETPEYIQCRRVLGGQEFDSTLALVNASDARAVCASLSEHGIRPKLVLAGFEQYTECAFAVAEHLKIPPYSVEKDVATPFRPIDKAQQRTAVLKAAPWLSQPWHQIFSLHDEIDISQLKTRLPLVIKPVNSGGGWGISLSLTEAEIEESLNALREMSNYDGSRFENVIAEEYIAGKESSVQGICRGGNVQILTYCEKIIRQEPASLSSNRQGFREIGHLSTIGENTPDIVKSFVFDCLKAVGYRNGAFHIDLITSAGEPFFIEMGFRLSGGGLVEIVRQVSGLDWGEEVFATFLENNVVNRTDLTSRVCLAQLVATKPSEIKVAQALREQGFDIEIQQFDYAHSVDEMSDAKYLTLSADLSRHIGKLGFIHVEAQKISHLRELAAQIFNGFAAKPKAGRKRAQPEQI